MATKQSSTHFQEKADMGIVKRKFSHQFDGKKFITTLPLDERAVDPNSVKLFWNGNDEFYPESFSETGLPIFSPEASLMLYCKDRIFSEARTTNSTEPSELPVYVQYRIVGRFPMVYKFNTFNAITEACKSLEDFNALCRNRKNYVLETGNKLCPFMVFGRIYFDENGNMFKVLKLKNNSMNAEFRHDDLPCDVLTEEMIKKYVPDFTRTRHSPIIPKTGEKCPCCGKEFTIDDLKGVILHYKNRIVHEECYKKLLHFTEVNEVIFNIIDKAFPDKKFKFTFISYPYDVGRYDKTWFIVHTDVGSIKIGRTCRYIHIKWQSDYAPWCKEIPYFETTFKPSENTIPNRELQISNRHPEYAITLLKLVHDYVLEIKPD